MENKNSKIFRKKYGDKKINFNKIDVLQEKEYFILKIKKGKHNKCILKPFPLIKYLTFTFLFISFIILVNSILNLKYKNYFINNNNYKNKNTYIENNNLFWKDNKNIQNESLYKEYKFPSLEESFNKSKDFLNKCSKGILINNKTEFKSSLNPKVSVIIPIYNSEKFINRAIKSVQNQDLLDLEIILINDFSTDNTQSVIEEIKKEVKE